MIRALVDEGTLRRRASVLATDDIPHEPCRQRHSAAYDLPWVTESRTMGTILHSSRQIQGDAQGFFTERLLSQRSSGYVRIVLRPHAHL